MFVFIFRSFFISSCHVHNNLQNRQIQSQGRYFDTWRFNTIYITFYVHTHASAYYIYYIVTVCGFVFVDSAWTTNHHSFYPSKLNSDLQTIGFTDNRFFFQLYYDAFYYYPLYRGYKNINISKCIFFPERKQKLVW